MSGRARRSNGQRLTVREAASLAAVDVVVIYDLIRDGRLPAPRRTLRGAAVPRFIPAGALAALLLPLEACPVLA